MSSVTEKGIPSHLEFPFHRQDYSDTCGAACAQMILDHHGNYLLSSPGLPPDPANPPNQLIGQSELVNEREGLGGRVKDQESRFWIISPSELVKILEKYGVAGYEALGCGEAPTASPGNDIYNFAEACRDAVDDMVGASYCPPMIAVDSIGHWVVLASCVSDATGILGFYHHDPILYSSGTPIPPLHFSGDLCSFNGLNGNAYITFEGLRERTSGRKIIVRRADGRRAMARRSAEAHDVSRIKPPDEKKIPALRRISNEEIAAKALSAIEKHGLKTRKGWDQLLARTSIGPPLRARQERQSAISDYYLAPAQNRNGETKMLVLMSAATGDFWGSLKVTAGHFLFRDDPKVRDLVNEVRVALRSKLRKIGIENANSWEREFVNQVNSTRTNLVWVPRRESESLFFPFYAIQPPEQSIAVYVRVDGEVFTSLTPRKE